MNESSYLERRTYPRHRVDDNSAVMLSPDNVISYNILDISRSGMAFSYDGKKLKSNLCDRAFIDLFYDNIGGVVDIPVKIISDTSLSGDGVESAGTDNRPAVPYLRRCGVEFGGLSEEQETVICMYIESLNSRM